MIFWSNSSPKRTIEHNTSHSIRFYEKKNLLNDMNFQNSTTDLETIQLEILAPIKEVPILRRYTWHSLGPSCNSSPLVTWKTRGFKSCAFTWRRLQVTRILTSITSMQPKEISEVIFHLRDINQAMTNAWEKEFAPYSDTVKVYLSSHSLKNAIC